MDPTLVALVLFAIFALIFILALSNFMSLYIRSYVCGAGVGMVELMGMQLRKIKPRVIVNSRIQAHHAGLQVTVAQMESHYLAGGNVQRVIIAMIAASKVNIDLPWQVATAIDLTGRDILDTVQKGSNQVTWPFVGAIGVAATDLRTGGSVEFPYGNDTRAAAVISADGFLRAGTKVVVEDVRGSNIRVRAAT
jgi:uncharacterized protein YqfA (UPF0365 family)